MSQLLIWDQYSHLVLMVLLNATNLAFLQVSRLV